MGRTVEYLAGLAAGGTASLGAASFRVPELLYAGVGDSAPGAPRPTLIDRGTARPGWRALALRFPEGEVPIDLPVPTPEISGPEGGARSAGPGVWMVRWPVPEADWAAVRAAEPEVVLLSNARTLWAEGEPFVLAIGELRQKLGARPLLWAPRVALPHRLALMVYLGVDLVDTTEAFARSAEGAFLDAELGTLDPAAVAAERTCDCPACRRGEPLATGGHAEQALDRELARVRTALRGGRLRELVEARLTAEPLSAEILRHADRRLAALLEERSPVTARGIRNYVLRESQRRPEVRRFRQRFLERYRPPGSKTVLLLLPCSKTKPYRASPSHRRIAHALDGLPNLRRLEVASVTSPLGLVPRELEDVPPARNYDIPVTGEWDEEERGAVRAALAHLIRTGAFRSVIAHLDPAEYGFLRPELDTAAYTTWTLDSDRTTSSEALRALRQAADSGLSAEAPIPGGPLAGVREELEAIAAFQFGPEAAHRLFQEPIRLQGRPWFQRLTDGAGRDLATWREERGLFHLTIAGAERMRPAHPMEVELRPEVPVTGDLFVPGVARADPAIRVGDAVLLVRDGALLAVGEAELPGRLMVELGRGMAVRIRHRAHAPVGARDRQPLDGVVPPRGGPVV